MIFNKQNLALSIVRIAAAGNMFIHGIVRSIGGGVAPFDEYLSSLGFPPYMAYAITVFEIIASLLIIANRWTIILCIIFCVQLLAGIFLVHAEAGWFVVGLGRNGMEYSVLLIVCFASTAVAAWRK